MKVFFKIGSILKQTRIYYLLCLSLCPFLFLSHSDTHTIPRRQGYEVEGDKFNPPGVYFFSLGIILCFYPSMKCAIFDMFSIKLLKHSKRGRLLLSLSLHVIMFAILNMFYKLHINLWFQPKVKFFFFSKTHLKVHLLILCYQHLGQWCTDWVL